MPNKIKSSIMGAILGDAMGVPAEYTSRHENSLCTVKNLLGYGRFDHPTGTWSDDSSIILCTAESLCSNYDLLHLTETYCKWLFEGYWTSLGYVFDAGLTTCMALDRFQTEGKVCCGCDSEDDNGNGSLMRMLPLALYFHDENIEDFMKRVHDVSSITHSHPRTLIGCGLFSLLVQELIKNDNKEEALRSAISKTLEYYNRFDEYKKELCHYMRIFSLELLSLGEEEIPSSGYIVETLEAAIWCFMKNSSTYKILDTAINLGLETDTAGTVAGGLAGLVYGLDDVPKESIESLARKREIENLIKRFSNKISGKTK
ncbi:MAG: ADP-ribosylglycohydrolase family protein [Fibrobacter sp.]|nr:ADP-ribosylglycohydrolase family protein [Fibrobacter sp.]